MTIADFITMLRNLARNSDGCLGDIDEAQLYLLKSLSHDLFYAVCQELEERQDEGA